MTRTFNTASWIYRGHADAGDGRLASGQRFEAPICVTSFLREFILWAPRSYIEKVYNVTYWTDMAKGGHLTAPTYSLKMSVPLRKLWTHRYILNVEDAVVRGGKEWEIRRLNSLAYGAFPFIPLSRRISLSPYLQKFLATAYLCGLCI